MHDCHEIVTVRHLPNWQTVLSTGDTESVALRGRGVSIMSHLFPITCIRKFHRFSDFVRITDCLANKIRSLSISFTVEILIFVHRSSPNDRILLTYRKNRSFSVCRGFLRPVATWFIATRFCLVVIMPCSPTKDDEPHSTEPRQDVFYRVVCRAFGLTAV